MKFKSEHVKYGFCAPRTFHGYNLVIGRTAFKLAINGQPTGKLFLWDTYPGPIRWLSLFNGKVWFGLVHYSKGCLLPF